MAMTDWFKKAKDAKKEKKKPKYGFMGSKDKAYSEAQEALDEEDKRQRGEMASAD